MSHLDSEASLSRRWRGNCFSFRSSISLGKSVPGACYSTERLALGFSDHQRLVSSRVPGWRLQISLSRCWDHPEGLLVNGLLASLPKLIQQTAGWHVHQGLRRGYCWHRWSWGVTAGEPWAGNMWGTGKATWSSFILQGKEGSRFRENKCLICGQKPVLSLFSLHIK